MAKRGGVVPAPAVLPVTPPSTATQVMTPPTYPATPTPPPVIPPSPPTTRAEPGLFPTGPAEEDETDDDEASAKRNRWLLIGLISVVAIIAIAVIVFLATRTGGDGADLPSSPPTSQSPSETASTVPLLTTVPPVSPGTTYDQALLALKALDLQGVRVDEASDDAPRDTVIRFDPASGQQVSPGDEVQIIVSTGPSEVTVPDVTDMTQQEAKAELEKFNLKGGDVSTENSARVEYNHVTRTEPQSKELVSAGSTVNLFVSTGKTTVPNVKGKTQKDAEAALQQAGLTFGTAKTEVSDQPAGTVLRQTPKANAEASQGEQVTLTIAREAVTVTVRQVEGETQEAAVAILRDEQGLIPEIAREFSETVPSGMVTRTDPGPGVSATEGSTIYVFVSNGPSPPPTDPVVTPPPDPIQTQTGEPMENY
jgi:serine/threonine-protein kinase